MTRDPPSHPEIQQREAAWRAGPAPRGSWSGGLPELEIGSYWARLLRFGDWMFRAAEHTPSWLTEAGSGFVIRAVWQ